MPPAAAQPPPPFLRLDRQRHWLDIAAAAAAARSIGKTQRWGRAGRPAATAIYRLLTAVAAV